MEIQMVRISFFKSGEIFRPKNEGEWMVLSWMRFSIVQATYKWHENSCLLKSLLSVSR